MKTLTPDELYTLTRRRRFSAQCRALDRAGIRYTRRIDGYPITTWDAVNSAIIGEPVCTGIPVEIKTDWINPNGTAPPPNR